MSNDSNTTYGSSIEEILRAQQEAKITSLELFDETFNRFNPALQTLTTFFQELKENQASKGLTIQIANWSVPQKRDSRYSDHFNLIVAPHTGEIFITVDRTGAKVNREETFTFNPASESYAKNQAQLIALGIAEEVIVSLLGFVSADGKTSLVKYLIENGLSELTVEEEFLITKLHEYAERVRTNPVKFEMA